MIKNNITVKDDGDGDNNKALSDLTARRVHVSSDTGAVRLAGDPAAVTVVVIPASATVPALTVAVLGYKKKGSLFFVGKEYCSDKDGSS